MIKCDFRSQSGVMCDYPFHPTTTHSKKIDAMWDRWKHSSLTLCRIDGGYTLVKYFGTVNEVILYETRELVCVEAYLKGFHDGLLVLRGSSLPQNLQG